VQGITPWGQYFAVHGTGSALRRRMVRGDRFYGFNIVLATSMNTRSFGARDARRG
jgi:hypothetical protein